MPCVLISVHASCCRRLCFPKPSIHLSVPTQVALCLRSCTVTAGHRLPCDRQQEQRQGRRLEHWADACPRRGRHVCAQLACNTGWAAVAISGTTEDPAGMINDQAGTSGGSGSRVALTWRCDPRVRASALHVSNQVMRTVERRGRCQTLACWSGRQACHRPLPLHSAVTARPTSTFRT